MKKNILFWAFFFINLISVICAASIAEEYQSSNLDKEKRLYEYLNGYENTNLLFNNALEVSNKLNLKCEEKYFVPIGEIDIIQPIEFLNDHKQPHSGLWKHKYMVRRCGHDLALNLFIEARDGKIKSYFAPLGDSILPFDVLNTTLKFAYDVTVERLYKQGIDCSVEDFSNTAIVSDTMILSDISKVILHTPSKFYTNKFYQSTNPLFESKVNTNVEWVEEWQINACKHEVKIKMKMMLKDLKTLNIELVR